MDGKCLCGCGGAPAWGEYLRGHDAIHRSNLIGRAGGVYKLEQLLSYSGPTSVSWALIDEEKNAEVDRLSAGNFFPVPGEMIPDVDGNPRWIVTRIGELTVDDWSVIPPTLHYPVYEHKV